MSRITFSLEHIMDKVLEVISEEEFLEGVRRATISAEVKVAGILEHNPFIAELAKEVKIVKEHVLNNIDEYIEETIKSLRSVNANPYLAESREEALEYIGKIVGKGKTVIMSKSMVAEEIGLREYLEAEGNEVWETDLGQLLIQLEGSKPMHSIAPAIHLTRDKVARLIRDKLGLDVTGDSPEGIVRKVREFLREKFVSAEVGISGANAIAADTGSVVLVENEGNIRLVTGLPLRHIVVTGIDKIVPTLIDAFKVAIVQAAYGGLYPPTYINVISGPSSTADIEHTRVYGAHGPLEVHVVLVDNGRRSALSDPDLKNQLRCVRCGRCQFECPVWQHTANIWGGPAYGGPMGIAWTAITADIHGASSLAYLCLSCRRCEVVCPMEIPLERIIRSLRRKYVVNLKA